MVVGDNYVGGILGQGLANIFTSSSYGNIEGKEGVGGIMGRGRNDKYNTMASISSSFTTGNIKGTKNVGGIIGEAYILSANNSYSTGTVLAEEEMAGGICGKLTIVGDIIACYSLGDISSPSFAGGYRLCRFSV